LIAVAGASCIAVLLRKINVPTSAAIFIYLLAIMVTAWRAGYGPGVLATLVSGVAGPYLLSARFDLSRLDPGRLALILVISLLVSKVAENRRKTEAALRSVNEDLDRRVRESTEELRRANDALRESEARLLRQAEELERSNADLEYFAYVASHDMQEPLRMVHIYAEILQRRSEGKLDPHEERFLKTVLEGTRRLQRLVVDLLEYSRTSKGPLDVRSAADMNELVRAATNDLSEVIHRSGATIRVSPLPALDCNAAQMTRVFQNLLSNAVKYCGARKPDVEVSASPAGEGWEFAVSDRGVGIKPEYHHSIFEPFKRLHGPEIEGSGIGLSTCKRIIERHGGRIWVESALGEGATFKFTIPSRVAGAANQDSRSSTIVAPAPPSDCGAG
jgi:signal transduction histidine kinase